MKTKITLHTPVFILLTSTKYFDIKTRKYWNNLIQNMIFLIKKMVSDYPFFNRPITISTKIDLIPMKVSQLIKITQPSIYPKTPRSIIYY
jgi:hypothetical protein